MHDTSDFSRKRLLLGVLLAIALSLVAFLALTTDYSSDDYWYSTFMDHGVLAYFREMKGHYLTFNGRMLVHFAAQLILHVGNILYAVFLVGSCVLIPTVMCLIGGVSKRDKDRFLLCMLLFTAGVLVLPRTVMVQGLHWISAACNYVLPTDMVMLEILLLWWGLRHERRCPRWFWLLLFFYCFLCGATTEQMGTVSVLISLGFGLKSVIQKNRRGWGCLISAVCGVCGLLTIFLSPATQSRLETETVSDISSSGGAFFQHIKTSLNLQSASFLESPVIPIVLAILFVYTGYILFRQEKVSKWCGMVWLVASLGSLTRFWLPGEAWLTLALIFFLLFVQVVVWFLAGLEELAFVMLAGLASLGVMLLTQSWGGRVFVPFSLCTFAVAAWVLTELCSRLRTVQCTVVVSALSVISFYVISTSIPGYWHNYQIERLNKTNAIQAQQSDSVYYCMDYDMHYTFSKPFQTGFTNDTWVDSLGVDSDACGIYFYSESLPAVYISGTRASLPAKSDANGQWLLPLRDTLDILGGELLYNSPGGADLTIQLNGNSYHYLADDSSVAISWQDRDGAEHCIEGERDLNYYTVLLSENVYTEAFGLDVVVEDGRIDINSP